MRPERKVRKQRLETGDSSLVDIAVSNLDAWSNKAVGRTGLIYTHYHWMLSGESDVEDTCNLGFAIKELSEAWEAARKRGLEKERWLQAAAAARSFTVRCWIMIRRKIPFSSELESL